MTESQEDVIEPEVLKATVAEFAPAEWSNSENSWLWVTCYAAMCVPKAAVERAPKRIVLANVVAVLYYGSPSCYPEPDLEFWSAGSPNVLSQRQEPRQGREGTYLCLILPYKPSVETDYQMRVKELTFRSLVSVVLGENVVYKKIFQNAVRADVPETSFFGPSIRNPLSLPVPDTSDARLKLIEQVSEAIERLGEAERNRVNLSLRWHGQAQDANGLDEFINRWVALEALGMSDRNNIRPLEEALSRAYSNDLVQVRKKFGVGRLFGFRSNILHHGLIPSVPGSVLDYMKALYKDILWEKLGFPCERAAEAMLSQEGFSLEALLLET